MAELRLVELSKAQGRRDKLDNLIKSYKHLGQRLKASEIASAKENDEMSHLSDKINALNFEHKDALLEMEKLKNEVGCVEKDKKYQYDACYAQIFKKSAKQFRFDWVQGQQPVHHRVVANPNTYNGEIGVSIANYESFFFFGLVCNICVLLFNLI
ncbi:uncharacterized protein Pyn_19529 [Prunus yedoensis var. nudiflora]|uniref:Uncharacterized protein n=1 Tax=Prunus yedoensis var. nudiflora TaxID=2094558 RepID=A0A314XZA1_PRUYE|nr:uncharacterized protein Pyn_19529 [Prunus yedoensis var. nudiflora]